MATSRYLTPSKLGLLALISIYVDGVVPTSSTIPILSFIVSHLLPVSKTESSSLSQKKVIELQDFENATLSHPSGIPGRTVWDLFLKKLWEIDCLDALHAFFDSLGDLIPKSREELLRDTENGIVRESSQMQLSRNSPLGAFVRKARLEFTRLQLDDGIVLWKSFVVYRRPTLATWRRRNPAASKLSLDVNLVSFKDEGEFSNALYGDIDTLDPKNASISTIDLEGLLEFQIGHMQSRLSPWCKS